MDVEDRADPSINSHLTEMMRGSSEEGATEDDGDDQRSPVKSKQKKITFAEATATKPVTKPAIKPPKPSILTFTDRHGREIGDYPQITKLYLLSCFNNLELILPNVFFSNLPCFLKYLKSFRSK